MSFLTNIENKHKNDDRFTKHFWLKLSSQNTRNGVFELQHFQIFWRSMPPYPLAARALDVCVIGLFKNIAIRNLGWTVWSLSNLTNHFLGIWYSVSRQFQVFGIQDFLSPNPPPPLAGPISYARQIFSKFARTLMYMRVRISFRPFGM